MADWLPYPKRIFTLRNTPAPMPGLCFECGQPLVSFDDAALIFIDPEDEGVRHNGPRIARIGHAMCAAGPYIGTAFDLCELVSPFFPTSLAWLIEQPWWDPSFMVTLHTAMSVAAALRDYAVEEEETPAPSPMRSVAASIPRRLPRVPSNPRAISVSLRARVMERDDFRCRRCGNGPAVSPLVVDHITPVAKGGTAAFDNLQTLCNTCNAGKSDRAPHPHDLGERA